MSCIIPDVVWKLCVLQIPNKLGCFFLYAKSLYFSAAMNHPKLSKMSVKQQQLALCLQLYLPKTNCLVWATRVWKGMEPKTGSCCALCDISEGCSQTHLFSTCTSSPLISRVLFSRQSETEMLPATHSEELNPDLTVLHLPPFTVQRCVDTSCPWECRPLYLRPRCCPHFPTPQMFCLPRNSTTSSVSHKQRLSSKNHRFPNPSGGGFGGELMLTDCE